MWIVLYLIFGFWPIVVWPFVIAYWYVRDAGREPGVTLATKIGSAVVGYGRGLGAGAVGLFMIWIWTVGLGSVLIVWGLGGLLPGPDSVRVFGLAVFLVLTITADWLLLHRNQGDTWFRNEWVKV